MKKTNLEDLFKDKKYLAHAFTHRSWVNENSGKRTSNERLEFLGDAILEYIVSKVIFDKYPDQEEGYLTALRSNIVNTVNLAKVAKKLGLGEQLLLSKGEELGGGRDSKSLLANTVESVIGALYLDGGLKSAENFVSTYILIDLEEIASKPLKDAKSRLQEDVQAKGLKTPFYKVVKESGHDHQRRSGQAGRSGHGRPVPTKRVGMDAGRDQRA